MELRGPLKPVPENSAGHFIGSVLCIMYVVWGLWGLSARTESVSVSVAGFQIQN